MGTNYYRSLRRDDNPSASDHIGKTSLLATGPHFYSALPPPELLEVLLGEAPVYDEYGEEHPAACLLGRVQRSTVDYSTVGREFC